MAKSKIIPRLFIVILMALILIDVCPTRNLSLAVKNPATKALDVLGLRQGSWAMFTPNPVLNNRWISAEMITKDGRTLRWDSPMWGRVTAWDKFVQFRYVNYYTRIYQPWCARGAQDFMNHQIRESGEELESIQLFHTRMELVMPEDGSLPLREEATWQLISEPWIGDKVVP